MAATDHAIDFDRTEVEQCVTDADNYIPFIEPFDKKNLVVSNGPDAVGGEMHAAINGENYHALQVLNQSHRGRVDVICIDPPYNTGNDSWFYTDNRDGEHEEYGEGGKAWPMVAFHGETPEPCARTPI